MKRKWLKLLTLIIVLLALVALALLAASRGQPLQNVFRGVFGRSAPRVTVNELNFDVGRSRVFARSQVSGSVASVGTLGLQVLGTDGRETLRESSRLTAPALAENNGRFLAFDIGGRYVRIFNEAEILHSIETEGAVVAASINSNGWFCIVTQEPTGSMRGTVSVYNPSGRQVFKVIMGSGFVLDARLSDNDSSLAILNITEIGSRVTLYDGINVDKDDPDRVFELGSEVFLDISFTSETGILAFGTGSVASLDISIDDSLQTLYHFEGKRLGGYTHTEQFIALHLYDHNIGYSGKLVSIDHSGALLGQFETFMEITSMSSSKDTLMLLGGVGLSFYDKNLTAYPHSESSLSAGTSGRVLALGDNMALAAGDLSAVVIRRGE